MDPFLIYLIGINVATFVVFALDFVLVQRRPELDGELKKLIVLDLFPVAGGVIGMLVALFVFTGQTEGGRLNKTSIAWWFYAFCCLIVWALVVVIRYGFVTLNLNVESLLTDWNVGALVILSFYAVVINVITYATFYWDKRVSQGRRGYKNRLPEAWLLGLCFFGGSLGGLIAVHTLRHKTKIWYFSWGISFFIIVDLMVVVFVHMCGLL